MNIALFAIALMMSIVAIGFVAMPLVRAQSSRSNNFENRTTENNGYIKLWMLGVLVVFGLGIALYGIIGRPDVQSHQPASTTSMASMSANGQAGNNSEKVGSVGSLLSGLEARLAENPEDGKGWLLLAQSYEVLGRLEDAASAYDRAVALGLTNEELAARLSGSSEVSQLAVEIRGHVDVDPAISESIEPGAVVYVIAKSPNNPMPLAVLRRSASELPFDFVLSEEDSMVKGAGMAAESELTITVKISLTGDALAAAPGFETAVHGIDPHSAEPLDIVIGKASSEHDTTTE